MAVMLNGMKEGNGGLVEIKQLKTQLEIIRGKR
jgi:hypothetical protein